MPSPQETAAFLASISRRAEALASTENCRQLTAYDIVERLGRQTAIEDMVSTYALAMAHLPVSDRYGWEAIHNCLDHRINRDGREMVKRMARGGRNEPDRTS